MSDDTAVASPPQTVSFTRMKDGTREDFQLIDRLWRDYCAGTADQMLAHLRLLEGSFDGLKVSRLEHCLQAGSRAHRDGADIDWVVTALLHDVGDVLAPHNHAEIVGAMVRPFVREECSWVVQHHNSFQNVYYAHFVGDDQFAREKYRGHPYFQAAVDFCERWDQPSFDPDYDTLGLEFFEPLLREVFAREAWSPAHIHAPRWTWPDTAP